MDRYAVKTDIQCQRDPRKTSVEPTSDGACPGSQAKPRLLIDTQLDDCVGEQA